MSYYSNLLAQAGGNQGLGHTFSLRNPCCDVPVNLAQGSQCLTLLTIRTLLSCLQCACLGPVLAIDDLSLVSAARQLRG